MKPTTLLFRSGSIIALLVVMAVPNIGQAQYAIRRSSFSTVGGASTGGTYSLRSAVGVTAAGAVAGGNYSVTGTPWNLIVVETPGAPSLEIFLTSSNTAAVRWPSQSAGYVLQQNTNDVSSVNWSNVTTTIQDDGTTKTFIVNPPTGSRFFRLCKP